MQRLEVSYAVRLIYMSLGAKGLTSVIKHQKLSSWMEEFRCVSHPIYFLVVLCVHAYNKARVLYYA